ncbi:hypothetical protein DMH17_11780 [Raoultella planticola]|nr:hypothetical protein [Raoultella planticola]
MFSRVFPRALPPRSIGIDWRRAVAGFGGQRRVRLWQEARRHSRRGVPSTPMSAGATTLHALLQMMTVAPDPQMGQRGFNL